MSAQVQFFFDPTTFTLTYLVFDQQLKKAIVIDPVWNYDQASSTLSETSLKQLFSFIDENELELLYIMETHAHADHISGAQCLKERYPGALVAIGARIVEVQREFAKTYDLPTMKTDGSQFDILLNEEDKLPMGQFEIKTIFTPGHTSACCSFLIDQMLFTGDTLFMPDFGTGRCDFPGGSASELYDSVYHKLYALEDEVKTFTGHDYQPGGRELAYQSTIGIHKKSNIHLSIVTLKDDYISFRSERDAKLKMPKLLLPSIQINIFAGHLPIPAANNVSYLKIPLTIA